MCAIVSKIVMFKRWIWYLMVVKCLSSPYFGGFAVIKVYFQRIPRRPGIPARASRQGRFDGLFVAGAFRRAEQADEQFLNACIFYNNINEMSVVLGKRDAIKKKRMLDAAEAAQAFVQIAVVNNFIQFFL